MMNTRIAFVFIALTLMVVNPSFGKKKDKYPVPPKRELRAVWVATVVNIDWPSKQGLTTEQQKQEVRDILNMHKRNGMNAIIMQIRPASDAFYQSRFEPWSRYLTGEQGKAPDPFYDPLEFWIDECHKRGMEFHAWCNPYRIKQSLKDKLAPDHIITKNPEWGWEYGNRLYFDPGHPEVRKFVTTVVRDVVRRYDLDAIHFDDYFYPYKVKGQEFPDSTTFRKFPRRFNSKQLDDWRRDNVDIIILMLSQAIKEEKPWVKFGISPFGVWRNKSDDPDGSDTRAGTTNYDHLYADILKWQREGWIDYTMPQLYWQIGHPAVDYNTLAQWWGAHAYGRGMYIGKAVYKADPESKTEAWREPDQLSRQIAFAREIPEIQGSAWFSSKHFHKELLGLKDSLERNYYRTPAVVPAMPWIDDTPPAAPDNLKVKKVKKGRLIQWDPPQTNGKEMDKARFYAVYRFRIKDKQDTGSPKFLMDVTGQPQYFVKRRFMKIFRRKYYYRVASLDRLYNESELSGTLLFKQ